MATSFNGTSQISTFIGGMNLDADLSALPKNSYRYAENIRLMSNYSGDATTVHGIDGFDKLTESFISFKYYEYDLDTDTVLTKYSNFSTSTYKIIGIGTIRNHICLFTVNLITGDNAIFRLLINKDLDDNEYIDLTRIVESDFNINDGIDKDISVVTYWEDFDNIKVYWADGVNALRSINIAESNDLNNYDKTPSFFDNTISIGTSKPTFDSFVSGNLPSGMVQYAYQMFDVNGSETKISALSDMIHLTKSNAFDVNYQGSEPSENTGKSCKIKFEVTDPRFSTCKIYRIIYTSAEELPKLYVAAEFSVTPKSEDGKNIQYYSDTGSVLNEITYEEFLTSDPYFFIPKVLESKDGRLFAANVIEDTWVLDNGEYDYDTRVFRFAQNLENGIHASVLSITGNDKIITYNDMSTMTDAEWYNFLPADHDCINPINSDFSDNLKRDTTAYEWFTDGTSTLQYKGGVGRNISYKIIHTRFGEDFYHTNSDTRSAFITKKISDYNGHTRDVTFINQGTYNDTGLPINYNIPDVDITTYDQADYYTEEPTEFSTLGPANYSNPYLDAKYRSYQRDDIYRFGVVFYNRRGQTTPVSWIGDIRMPSMSEYQHRLFDQWERIKVSRSSSNTNVYQVVTYPMGLQFSFNNIPEDVYQIEVVRCERTRNDRRVLAQGLISRTGTHNSSTGPLLTVNYNTGFAQWLSYDRQYGSPDISAVMANTAIDMTPYMNDSKPIYTFLSPEILYFGDSASEIANRITKYELLYGMSSPTFLVDPYENADSDARTYSDLVRNTLVHTYNSQIWFNGEVQISGAPLNLELQRFMDGSTGRKGDFERTFYLRGYSGFNLSGATYYEEISKYVAKMYHPYTWYKGDMYDFNITTNRILHNISSIKYAQGLNFNQYEDIQAGLHKIQIGSNSYRNWSIDRTMLGNDGNYKIKHGNYSPCFVYNNPNFFDQVPRIKTLGTTYDNFNAVQQCNYFGHKSFDIYPNTNNNESYRLPDQYSKSLCYALNATFLVNMYQDIIPYGGQDFNNRANSTYISTQSLVNVEDFPDPVITVFSGDTYVGITEQIQQHWYYLASDPIPGNTEYWNKCGEKAQIVLFYPCESSINQSMTHGSLWHTYSNISTGNNVWMGNPGTFPNDLQLLVGTHVSNGFVQERNLYVYNSVYSSSPLSITFLPRGMYTEDNKNFDYRVLYSEKKTNDEISDSWLKFRVANYLDVDTRFGSINNLKLFNNSLFFWQDDAFGELPVNERSLITDNNDAQLLLGTGTVLNYYKYITQSNGSKKDVINNTVVSPSALYWYDHKRAEIMALSNQSLDSMGKSKNIQSWFNKHKSSIKDKMQTLYDKKYNEVHFRFEIDNEDIRHLIYAEPMSAFSGFYTYNSDWFIDLKDNYYSFKDNLIFKHDSNQLINKFFTDTQEDSKVTYVVNDNYANTKVFDNVSYYAEFDDNNNLQFRFSTTSQNSYPIDIDDIDEREDTYKFAIPRSEITVTNNSTIAPQYNDRMRGKYLISYLTFQPNAGDTTFKLPYITTAYRISNI